MVALEDLLKRVLIKLREVKEIRPFIFASKKGIDVSIRLVLVSDVNIPELTAKVQEISKKKIQDTVGLEEPITIEIYISKILSEKAKPKKPGDEEELEEDIPSTNIPFRGYRA